MRKKKPVVKFTTEPASYTVLWVDRLGSTHEDTFTDPEKAEARYYKLYLEYINSEIRELEIRSDV